MIGFAIGCVVTFAVFYVIGRIVIKREARDELTKTMRCKRLVHRT